MSEYRVPGRDIDMTEIEREKIRQAEETKRKLIEQKAETRRREIAERDTIGYVAPRLFTTIVALACVIAIGTNISSYLEGKAGGPPCHDTVDIRTPSSDPYHCERGARVVTEPFEGGKYTVKCLCGVNGAPDGGAP